MATWKKILTKDSAVGSDGLLFVVEAGGTEGATLRLADGTNVDDIAIVAGTGIDFSSTSASGFTIDVDTSEITSAIQDELTDATLISSTSNTNNVTLTLTGPGSETDAVEIVAGTGITLANNTDGQFTITNSVTDTNLSQEEVEDFVGGMLDGTETGIAVDYDDTAGNINFVVDDQTLQASTTGATNLKLTMSNPTTDDDITLTLAGGLSVSSVSAGAATLTSANDNTQLSEEEVEDIVGGMLGGTETGISVDYVDGAGSGDGTINFVVADQSLTTAQATNDITITMSNPTTDDSITVTAGDNITLTDDTNGGFTIAASATASNVSVTDSDANETAYLVFTTSTSGSAALKVDSSTLSYNASSDTLTVNNLTVAGTQTTVNTTELVVADKNIVIADGSATAAAASGAGITVDIASTAANMPQFLWNNAGSLTGWTLSNYNATGNTDFPVSAMEFDAVSGAPGSGDNAAGVGSFHMNTADGKLYIRTV